MLGLFRLSQTDDSPQAGFSMVELLVVMVIVGIFAAVASTGLMEVVPKHRLNGAARALRGDLVDARSRATKTMKQYRISQRTSGGYLMQQGNARTGSTTWDANAVQPAVIRDLSEWSGVSMDTAAVLPVFNPSGTCVQSSSLVLRHEKAGTKTITVSLTGRIRIE